MTATTPKLAIPYSLPGDRLADFPVQADKAQAEKLEAILTSQLIMAAGVKTASYSPAANADVPVGWDSFPITDPTLVWTGGAGRCDFTIGVAGTYLFEAQLKLERNTTSPTARQQMMIWKNGASFFVSYKLSNSTTYETLSIIRPLRLVVGDKVGLYYRVGGTGATILGDAVSSGMTLTRLGP